MTDNRTDTIKIRVTSDEKNYLLKVARGEGMTLSMFLRWAGLKQADVLVPVPDPYDRGKEER